MCYSILCNYPGDALRLAQSNGKLILASLIRGKFGENGGKGNVTGLGKAVLFGNQVDIC